MWKCTLLKGHSGWVEDVCFSDDGQWIASCSKVDYLLSAAHLFVLKRIEFNLLWVGDHLCSIEAVKIEGFLQQLWRGSFFRNVKNGASHVACSCYGIRCVRLILIFSCLLSKFQSNLANTVLCVIKSITITWTSLTPCRRNILGSTRRFQSTFWGLNHGVSLQKLGDYCRIKPYDCGVLTKWITFHR